MQPNNKDFGETVKRRATANTHLSFYKKRREEKPRN